MRVTRTTTQVIIETDGKENDSLVILHNGQGVRVIDKVTQLQFEDDRVVGVIFQPAKDGRAAAAAPPKSK